jgi:hypothetical protein
VRKTEYQWGYIFGAAIASSWNKLTPARLRSLTATRWLTHED